MYESGHSSDDAAMRHSLRLLEAALKRHEPLLARLPAHDGAAAAFERSVALLRQEADRLRLLLQD
jgi:hypothetical protein